MSLQTTTQILRCFNLGRYTAAVEGGELKIRGPQPLAGPLPASIKARREELIGFLEEACGGAWPPAPGSEAHEKLTKGRPAPCAAEERGRRFAARLKERRTAKREASV